MGNLIWHEYARLVSVTACVYTIWSSFYALIYRKFFWDFMGGTLRDPGGYQTAPGATVFTTMIIKVPVVQLFSMVLGVLLLAIEYPIPPLKNLSIRRSFVFKIVMLLFLTFFTCLYYQGTNAAIYSFIAACCYIRAQVLGEKMEEAKSNRGKEGAA
jgi:hypothetical protein